MPDVQTPPTMSTAFLCSMAASLGLTQITRHLLGLGEPVVGTFLSWCGYTHETRIAPLKRNPDCPVPHGVWKRVRVAESLHRCTLRELVAAAGVPLGDGKDEAWFTLGGLRFHETIECCGCNQPVGRFGVARGIVGRCSSCGGGGFWSIFFR